VTQALVLGAGINGAATARELVLHGFDVIVVDTADVGSGTTAYSSRLIHGGLRYLEFGDVALVRESLAERERLLRLAPDFVKPLEFRVPTSSRLGGVIGSTAKLLFGKTPQGSAPRGQWLVRISLQWYALLAADSAMPAPRSLRAAEVAAMKLSPVYRGVCSYFDAQMTHPERFTVALLDDARRAATERGSEFRVHTYAEATVVDRRLRIGDRLGRAADVEYRPDCVINAGGPWSDDVLRGLGRDGSRLIAGTKGSHVVTFHAGLRQMLGNAAIYVEADDGRPVFVIPFGAGTLVGTTDLRYEGDPAAAVASEAEIEYLLKLVNRVMPSVKLTRDDVALHYSGVRPLPRSDAATPAAISRRHAVVQQAGLPWPVWTLVGGKLTTCRAFAEDVATVVAKRFDRPTTAVSRERPIPDYGGAVASSTSDTSEVPGLTMSRAAVRQVIRDGFVRRLDDLVERRLMLLFEPQIASATLFALADLLVDEGLLEADRREVEVARVSARLRDHFGRRLSDA